MDESFYTVKGAMFAETTVECFYFGHRGIHDNRALGTQSSPTLAHDKCLANGWYLTLMLLAYYKYVTLKMRDGNIVN